MAVLQLPRVLDSVELLKSRKYNPRICVCVGLGDTAQVQLFFTQEHTCVLVVVPGNHLSSGLLLHACLFVALQIIPHFTP